MEWICQVNFMKPSLNYEKRLWRQGYTVVAGVDEVGRGAWAGPLVAAAVVLPTKYQKQSWHRLVNDSKKLAPGQRERIFTLIEGEIVWSIGLVDNKMIDKIGVAEANKLAVKLAVNNLKLKPGFVLTDFIARLGRQIAGVPARSIVKGDGRIFSIALASIIAKVQRDRLMIAYEKKYPGYGFASHKGYATPEHQRAIREFGPCPIHRRSFDYIRELCGQYCEIYYSLKQQGYSATSRDELSAWESTVKAAAPSLSLNENKKLHLLSGRLWKRLSRSSR